MYGGSSAILSQTLEREVNHFLEWGKFRYIIGLTVKGRATVTALGFNRSRVINIRAADLEINRHPPTEDPIQD